MEDDDVFDFDGEEEQADQIPKLLYLAAEAVVEILPTLPPNALEYTPQDLKDLLFGGVVSRGGELDSRSLIPFLDADIRSLNLDFRSVKFVEAFYQALATYCPNLDILSLQACTSLSYPGLEKVLKSCASTLGLLNISFCHQLRFPGFLPPPPPEVVDSSRLVNQATFSLPVWRRAKSSASAAAPQTSQAPRLLKELLPPLPHLSQLQTLRMKSLSNLQDHVVKAFVAAAPLLQELQLDLCQNLTVDIFPALQKCEHLRRLGLNGCLWVRGEEASRALQQLPRLEALDITGTHVYGEPLAKLLEALPNLRAVKISLQPIYWEDYTQQVSYNDVPIEALNPEVHTLQVFCPKDKTIDRIIEKFGSSLRWLSLPCAQKLTDAHLLKIARNCPGLVALDLTGNACYDGQATLSRSAVREVALSCTKLRVLKLAHHGLPTLSLAEWRR